MLASIGSDTFTGCGSRPTIMKMLSDDMHLGLLVIPIDRRCPATTEKTTTPLRPRECEARAIVMQTVGPAIDSIQTTLPKNIRPAATAHQLGAANVRQLSNGNALRQSGVSPPERLIAPFVARWQTLAERNTRMFLRGNSLDAPFGGFLTRVCNTCETNILQEICHMNANTIQHHPATTHRDWENWPRVSCTCKSKLGITNPPQERLCKRDRENVWTGLVEKKNLNDQWLRNIQLDGRYRNPKLIEATTATKRDRVWSGPGVGQPNRGFWRVCRCGKEVAPVVRPNVYICMACEGWVSLPNAPINPNRLSLKEVSRLRRQFNTTYKLRRTLPDLGLPQ